MAAIAKPCMAATLQASLAKAPRCQQIARSAGSKSENDP